MISFRQKGDFSKVTSFLEKAKEVVRIGDLDKYGREGVAALASATPVDTTDGKFMVLRNRKQEWVGYDYF